MKADAAFEVKEGDEAAAIALAREGKVRAAIVLPPGFGRRRPRAHGRRRQARRRRPLRPSQATALTMVHGLLRST